MAPDTEHLVAAALKLPREERTEVVDRLLRSLDEEEDLLEDDDRERLHDAIERSQAQFDDGQGIPADVVLDGLTKR